MVLLLVEMTVVNIPCIKKLVSLELSEWRLLCRPKIYSKHRGSVRKNRKILA